MSQVNITLNTNTVDINTTNNQIVVTDPTNPTTVNITQPVTSVVEVITAGPQGPQGIPGPIPDTGSFVTTSSFNAFTSSYNTGSFTGSFNGSFTGNLIGTSSWASNAISSSYALSSSFASTASVVESIANNITNNQDNYILTATGGSTINGEELLTFDGDTLRVDSKLEQGNRNTATGGYSHAEGDSTQAIGRSSHAEGNLAQAIGEYSHAEGDNTQAKGDYSHAEGQETISSGSYSHAEGYLTIAQGDRSHAEGESTQASGAYSHTEGEGTQAQGQASHAEGRATVAFGRSSHAEGEATLASGQYSHAEGSGTETRADYSHTEGLSTIASGDYQHVQGQYNRTSNAQSAFIIGNGTDDNNRSNLIFAAGNTVQVTGSLQVSGSITGSLFGTSSFAISSSRAVTSSFAISSSFASTASFAPAYLPLTGGTINGSLTINNNLTVLGSASIQYISESTLNIGTNLITVNTINPGARFGGLAVIDSGSSPQVSASFLYDSIKDEFVFVHHSTPTTSSVFLQGPETYNDLGNELYLTANRIPKGTGIEHLNDSNISDNGSVVSINSNTQVTGSLNITGSTTLGGNLTTNLTAGSVPFISSSGLLTQDNSNFFWNNTNKRLGIGTNSPQVSLHVFGTNELLRFGDDTSGNDAFMSFNNRGYIGFKGSGGLNFIAGPTRPIIFGTGNNFSSFTESARFSATNGNFLINTATDSGFRLDVNGTTRLNGNTTITGSLSAVDTTAASGSANSGSLLDLNQTWNTTGAPTAINLNVTDTASNANSLLMDLRVGGTTQFRVTKAGFVNLNRISFRASDGLTAIYPTDDGFTYTNNGNLLRFQSNMLSVARYGYNFRNATGTLTWTSGNGGMIVVSNNYAPTSGTGTWTNLLLENTINQTGGANGITRGLFINPTLTSAFDFRAIETTNGTVSFTDTYEASGSANSGSLLDLNQTWNTTGTPTAIRLNVTDTASNANSNLMDLRVGNVSRFSVTKSGTVWFGSGINFSHILPSGTTSADSRLQIVAGQGGAVGSIPLLQFTTNNNITSTSGNPVLVGISRDFVPTSGNATYTLASITGAINQTGGANGITRGLFVNPTLTSAADFRAIENTVGNVTLNTTSGNTSIGKTNPNARLDVNGNTIITGSLAVSQSLLQYSNITAITSGSTANIASFPTSSYTAGFFDFVATSGTNARAGTVFTVWNANNVEFTETSTNDIGNTSNLILSVSLSAGAIRLQGTSISGSWSVKTLTRMI